MATGRKAGRQEADCRGINNVKMQANWIETEID